MRQLYGATPASHQDPSKMDLTSRQDLVISNIEEQIRRVDKILSETQSCNPQSSSSKASPTGTGCPARSAASPMATGGTTVSPGKLAKCLRWPSELRYPVDIVVNCDPTRLPATPWALRDLLGDSVVQIRTHVHSTFKGQLPATLNAETTDRPRSDAKLIFTVIIRSDMKEMEFMCDPVHQTVIAGEANLLRYICRLVPVFPAMSVLHETQSDHLVDVICSGLTASARPRDQQLALKTLASQLEKRSGGGAPLVCDKLTPADFCLRAALTRVPSLKSVTLPASVQSWQQAVATAF